MGKRYSSALGDDCDESISCSYYEGNGFLSPDGCETVDVTDEYVDCACDHYSNFGLLFNTCNSEDWTIYRIFSLALLAFFWITISSLMLLVTFSSHFRKRTGLETLVEKRARVLGDKSVYQRSSRYLQE
uniref:GPS domain-containing protein n=1 Tax=Paramoeba aestuarina TaxID=180227 RepID=A0A7S4L3K9_9EUKA|mmetsp:Transcript_30915/g.48167  ORF Transcript_30915/g.48167 Transcript_30915/m.48167 type:complete len:129 (+) Transcript_30915:837-1223(+)